MENKNANDDSQMPPGTAMKSDLEKILTCDHHDPFQYLGGHFDVPKLGLVTLRTFQPHAREVRLLLPGISIAMTRSSTEGLFETVLTMNELADPL